MGSRFFERMRSCPGCPLAAEDSSPRARITENADWWDHRASHGVLMGGSGKGKGKPPSSRGSSSGKGATIDLHARPDWRAERAQQQSQRCTAECAAQSDLVWLPLPRVAAHELTYDRFLEEFAIPGKPFLLYGATGEWPVRSWTLDSIAQMAAGEAVPTFQEPAAERRWRPVGEAVAEMQQRTAGDRSRLYIRDWEYSGVAALAEQLQVPHWFDHTPSVLHESTFGLEGPPSRWRWLYIGEAGTGSTTHLDPMDSSAWLLCVSGLKKWRAVHSEDMQLVTAEGGELLPDLFNPDPDHFPGLRTARLYEGVQTDGEIMFNPSLCVHAVRNASLTISCTHNYVDATNLSHVLHAVAKSAKNQVHLMASLDPKERLDAIQEVVPKLLREEQVLTCAATMQAVRSAAMQSDRADGAATQQLIDECMSRVPDAVQALRKQMSTLEQLHTKSISDCV